MGEGEKECLLCGERFASEEEFEAHYSAMHEPEERIGVLGWLIAVPVLLWEARGLLIGLAVVVAIVLGVLGVFDNEGR